MTKRRNDHKRSRFPILFPILTILGIGIFAVLTSGFDKSWLHNWNDVSKSIKDSVLVAKNIGYTGGTGPNGRSMEKYAQTRLWIMNSATNSELLNLTKYPNGTVKAIGYEGLIKKIDFNEKTNLILKSIEDKEFKIFYSMGCEGFEIEISEYLMRFILTDDNHLPPIEPELKIDYGLSRDDKVKIMTAYLDRNNKK
ncbi:hypothetical protein [Algibacter mikhailovii]|uniref:Uncharacterized protein n=1 Tax=Algibacter mikhailovii TaxID=425498 RepID=A0A918VED3_9FLAO|nr:hypothetical protein [Algibacter mikhailovii]GGZ94726.1 hypothetical protein GCM10007028_36230 [Algibacter mikhailovii]